MNRLIANLSSFIASYKRDDTEGTLVGNVSLDTDWNSVTFNWSNDRDNDRTIALGTVISSVPDINGGEAADVTLSADVIARAKTKEGRRLYRVSFTESSEKYIMILDVDNNVIDRRG